MGKLDCPVHLQRSGYKLHRHPSNLTLMASLSRLSSRMMASSKSSGASQRLAALSRQFSSSPATQFEVKKLGVIGAGQMGLGIALVAAQRAGVPVTLVDTNQASIDKGLAFADKLLAKDVSKQRITQSESDTIRELLKPSTTMDYLSEVDFVIEAVPEIP